MPRYCETIDPRDGLGPPTAGVFGFRPLAALDPHTHTHKGESMLLDSDTILTLLDHAQQEGDDQDQDLRSIERGFRLLAQAAESRRLARDARLAGDIARAMALGTSAEIDARNGVRKIAIVADRHGVGE